MSDKPHIKVTVEVDRRSYILRWDAEDRVRRFMADLLFGSPENGKDLIVLDVHELEVNFVGFAHEGRG